MQPESPTIPHTWFQWVYVAVAAFLAYGGGLITAWFRRKHGPAEVAKLNAETRNIHTTADVSFGGLTLETFREIQSVIQKAEARREEWLAREEQMRNQILFWRNKAEELDGQLIDERYEHAQTQTRLKMKKDDLEKAMGIIKGHHLSFAELDHPREAPDEH
jgi:hypothetical protein